MIIKQCKHKIAYYKTKQQAKMGAADENSELQCKTAS